MADDTRVGCDPSGVRIGCDPGHSTAGYKIPVECYSRIVGYLRPVANWNPAKQQEFKDRRVFDVGPIIEAQDAADATPRKEAEDCEC